MNGWFNPDGWLDIVSQILLVIGVVASAAIPAWISAKKTQREIREVKDQVVNGHKSPLRSDLDRVLERLEELSVFITEISRSVAGIRAELIDEEARRRESVKELRDDLGRSRGELKNGISHIESRINDLEGRISSNE